MVAPAPAPVFEPVGDAAVVELTENSARFKVGRATVEVTALAPDLFRVGLFGDGRPVDYRSEAGAQDVWQPDGISVESSADGVRISTGSALARVSLQPLRIAFEDSNGRRFAVDDAALWMGFAPRAPADARLVDPMGAPARVYKQNAFGTHYSGCGERTGGLEKTGSHQVFWNIDPPGGRTSGLHNLYTSMPFVLALQAGQALGNVRRQQLPGRIRSGPRESGADRLRRRRRSADLLRVHRPDAASRSRALHRVDRSDSDAAAVGPRLSPEPLGLQDRGRGAAVGAHVSAALDSARGVYLDIDYMNGYRIFTWDSNRFAEPAGLMNELDGLVLKLVTIVDPGIKLDENYAVYTPVAKRTCLCAAAGSIQLTFETQAGDFDPGRETVELDLRGVGQPSQVLVEGRETDSWKHADGRLQIRLPWSAASRTVEIRADSL
jgi:alpha-glucosidase